MGTYSISNYSDQPRSCLFILSTYLAQLLSVEVLCTSSRDIIPQQARWVKELARFNFKIEYKLGENNPANRLL